PISQQIEGAGAAPPVIASPASDRMAVHDAPLSSLRSIAVLAMRHRRDGSGDTSTTGANAGRAFCSSGACGSCAARALGEGTAGATKAGAGAAAPATAFL